MISLHTCNDKNDEKRTLTTCRSLFFSLFSPPKGQIPIFAGLKMGWALDIWWWMSVFLTALPYEFSDTHIWYWWWYIPLIPILIPLESRYVASSTMGTWHTSLSHGSGSRMDPDPWWKNSLRPQLELWFVRGNYPRIAELFRSVNYDNLPICTVYIYIYICSHI